MERGKIITTLQILATLLLGGVAFLLFCLSLTYGGIPLFSEHRQFFASVAFSVIYGLEILYLVLVLTDFKNLSRLITITLVFLVGVAILYYVLCFTGFIYKINSIQSLREYISSFGNLSAILFIVFQFLQVVVLPVPGAVSVAAGVALFGALPCVIYSFIGIVLGSIVAFFIGKVIGTKAVSWIVGKDTLQKWLDKLKGKDYLILSLMFLLPLFPDDVLCFVAGLSSMTWLYFIVMILITRAISVVTTAYSFDLIPLNTWWGIVLWLIIIVMVALSFVFVMKNSDKIDVWLKKGRGKASRHSQKSQKNF